MGNQASSDPSLTSPAASASEEYNISTPAPNNLPSGSPQALVETSFDITPESTDEECILEEDESLDFSISSMSSDEDEDEWDQSLYHRNAALADARRMKEVVSWYLHPERKVQSGLQARDFFSRPSAPVQESLEDANARAEALADAAHAKEVASWYLHPEKPVPSGLQARDFFSRPSAVPQESRDYADARADALADAKRQAEVARWYLHPEAPVLSGLQARDFFSRASAPVQESRDYADARAEALADAKHAKEVASWYLHPSSPVVVDPASSARAYAFKSSSSGATTKRTRGESAVDIFEMEGEHLSASMVNVANVSLKPVAYEDAEQHGAEKEGNLSRSPSSVMLFDETVA